ncbi:MAG: AAA family ATPase, partial [Saprospiraceae bacterium]|nr:AAA family ATPase [Saprospiraceae bacterium]
GVGIVQGPYRYEAKDKYPHIRPVHWLTSEPWEYVPNLFPGYPKLFRADVFSPTPLGPEIITEYLKQYPQYRDIFQQYGLAFDNVETRQDFIAIPGISPLNTILYGPPGTGKTYNTITRAVKIATGKDLPHKEAKKQFDALIESGQVEFITFHQNYTYEDFVLGLKPDLDTQGTMRFRQHEGVFYRLAMRARENWERSQNQPAALKNFVLIIDEINRANISRVFGELITLLEADKRLGAENALTVRLPGQNEQEPRFGVPPNCYLIGTMNTADKSIALVDVALRRRFEFEALYPPKSGEVMPGLLPFYQQKLQSINTELLQRRGPDFLLGHAFFLDKTEDQFMDILQKKLIPLLLEYFNGKIELVRDVLKTANVMLTGEWPPYTIQINP